MTRIAVKMVQNEVVGAERLKFVSRKKEKERILRPFKRKLWPFKRKLALQRPKWRVRDSSWLMPKKLIDFMYNEKIHRETQKTMLYLPS